MTLLPTASQTAGPYAHIGLAWLMNDLHATVNCPGQLVTIQGRVLDGDGQPVTDAILEFWQADAHGQYAESGDQQPAPARRAFRGFVRAATDAEGRFQLLTIKPGPVTDPQAGRQAPHILVSIFMRGLLKRLVTRVYFPDEQHSADDYVLGLVPAERRTTLIARQLVADKLEWDIHLQGADETAFFDC